MDSIKRLILLYIPISVCNLSCDYCFVAHTESGVNKSIFKYDTKRIVNALSKKRLGGACLINLTANGETLLYKDLIDVVHGLLDEGHYVEIVTNATVERTINKILEFPLNLQSRVFFKISYHYQQLELHPHIKEAFWRNVERIKKSPCSFTLEIMPNDRLMAQYSDVCAESISKVGALCHATVGRNDAKVNKELLTDLTKKEYVAFWDKLNSEMFRFKIDLLGVKRKEYCYAGKWSILINLANGEAMQCYGRPANQNVFEDINKKIIFYPVGRSCMQAFCFNGHSHLALGMIPELETPFYSEIRDRECLDGSHWLKEPIRSIFHQKLYENNDSDNRAQRFIHFFVNPFFLLRAIFFDAAESKRRMLKLVLIISGKYKRGMKNK